MSKPIVKILPLSVLMRAISRAEYEMAGRRPTRVVACRVQIERWVSDLPVSESSTDGPWGLSVMGVPVVFGPDDAAPELIWAISVTDGQNAGGY